MTYLQTKLKANGTPQGAQWNCMSLPRFTCRRYCARVQRRRGSTYFLVIGVAMIAMSIALGAIAIAQAQRRANAMQADQHNATVLAQSAVQQGLAQLASDPNWRTNFSAYQNTSYSPPVAMNQGAFSWQLSDPLDGIIENDRTHLARIVGKATSGRSRRAFSVLCVENGLPLDVLRSAVHADGDLKITEGAIVGQGPLSTNGQLLLSQAELFGDVEANSIDVTTNINGVYTTAVSPKKMPARMLFDVYRLLATEFSFSDIPPFGIRDRLIAPQYPPTHSATQNPDGLYFVRVPAGETLWIEQTRMAGTLVVLLEGASSELHVGAGVVWKPFRNDYPALMVKTASDNANQITIECRGQLDEHASNLNFNPVDVPYFNSSDALLDDTYSASMRGLIHVIREVADPQSKTTIVAENKIQGCIVVEGKLDISGISHLQADQTFMTTPPIGYTFGREAGDLLANGTMETQVAPWFPVGATPHGGDTRLRLISPTANSSYGIEVSQRANGRSGIAQDLTNRLESGLNYNGSFWLKLLEQNEDVRISLEIRSADTLERFTQVRAATTSWSQISFSLTPVWTGKLESARLTICTSATKQSFQIDQATLSDPRSFIPSQIHLFDATWQQEAFPQ
jgi:hypothetical protein